MAITLRLALILLVLSSVVTSTMDVGAKGEGRSSAVLLIPIGNLTYGSQPVASDSTFVYGQTRPLSHKSTADHPFLNFHVRMYIRRLHIAGRHLKISAKRILWTGARGKGIAGFSVVGGHLLYEIYNPVKEGYWELHLRSLRTGHDMLIDSSSHEGTPSLLWGPRSDGHSVVWTAWKTVSGTYVSALHVYDLATRRSRILAQGGSQSTWGYTTADVSGKYVTFVRQDFRRPTSQVMLLNTHSKVTRQLTLPHAVGSEPAVSGDLVGWKIGAQFRGGHGVEIYRISTGRRQLLPSRGNDGIGATD